MPPLLGKSTNETLKRALKDFQYSHIPTLHTATKSGKGLEVVNLNDYLLVKGFHILSIVRMLSTSLFCPQSSSTT